MEWMKAASQASTGALDWGQFVSTLAGALAGALVAGLISWIIARRTLSDQRDAANDELFSAALATLFSAIRTHVEVCHDSESAGFMRPPFPPSADTLQIDVDIAWMAAWRPDDTAIMLSVGKVVYPIGNTTARWRIRKLPYLVETLRMWRTGELRLVGALGALENLAAEVDDPSNRAFPSGAPKAANPDAAPGESKG